MAINQDIFISYSSIDKDIADKVCLILEENGISCWMAPRNITPGVPFAEAIIDGIKSSKVFVLIYSSNSNNSTQVIREVDRAVHNGLSIINLRLEDVPLSKQLEYYVGSVHWLDAVTPPLDQHIHQLCNVVQMFLKPEDVKDVEIAEALSKGIIKQNEPAGSVKKPRLAKRKIIQGSGILLAIIIAIVILMVFKIGGIREARAGSIGSLVILPFNNYTGQDSLDWFVSGMHSSLIQDMGTVGGLRIIGETSSNAFKNVNLPVTAIATKLNVDAVIEADVLCLGEDSVCFQTRLIKSGREEEQLWVADYKVARTQILNWYKGVTKQIAKEIKVKLTPEQQRLLSKSRTVNRNTYYEYLKALDYSIDYSRESLLKAKDYLNNAIMKEPDWAPLYLAMAVVWSGIEQCGYEPGAVSSPKIYENLNKALELDPDLPGYHSTSALTAQLTEWNWEKSEKEFLRALAINPNDASSRVLYAQLLCVLQRPDEALTQGELAISLDPLNPSVKCLYSAVLIALGKCKPALDLAEEVLDVYPEHLLAYNGVSLAAYLCKDYDKAFQADINYVLPPYIGENALKGIKEIYHDKGFCAAYEEIAHRFEKLASNNPRTSFTLAGLYIYANQPDKAMDWLEKAYEEHDRLVTYITTGMTGCFDPLFNNPRFIALVKKMKLPLPKD